MAVQLVWFKRDLRTSDHAPLAAAAKAGLCVGLYVYEPYLLENEDCDAAHLQFVNDSLVELRKRLRSIGGELLLRTGRLPDVFEDLRQHFHIAKIWAHEETFNHISYQRDRRVRAWAKQAGVAFEEIPQYAVVRRLKNRDGWARQAARRMKEPLIAAPSQIEAPAELSGLDPGDIQTAANFKIRSITRSQVQVGGEAEAAQCLATFQSSRGVNYRADMSSPVTGASGCSRLSPYIAYGNISMRTIHHRTEARIGELKTLKASGKPIEPTWLRSLSSFKSRLSWHCHFMQKLEDEPTIEFENMNRAYDGLREQEFNHDFFDAWCAGLTGYPMIDACMRALHQTGWINFRMRAMLASFAAYHLWLHWRKPAVYLARLFVDYEPGIHYSQMQMQSGVTGINTVRIYSPLKQVIDQDPQGVFIRQYLPELSELPDKHLVEPHKMTLMEQSLYGCQIGKDYPAPIVDHKTQYRIARDKIHGWKRRPETRAASAAVYEKHGSRKTPMSRRDSNL